MRGCIIILKNDNIYRYVRRDCVCPAAVRTCRTDIFSLICLINKKNSVIKKSYYVNVNQSVLYRCVLPKARYIIILGKIDLEYLHF